MQQKVMLIEIKHFFLLSFEKKIKHPQNRVV